MEPKQGREASIVAEAQRRHDIESQEKGGGGKRKGEGKSHSRILMEEKNFRESS